MLSNVSFDRVNITLNVSYYASALGYFLLGI
nr:MAG TPA: hypothetical protein [Caudoviricetes sp.]